MTIDTKNGKIIVSDETEKLIAANPWNGVSGVIITPHGENLGVKNSTATRTRKRDGVVVGQVYAGGPNKSFAVVDTPAGKAMLLGGDTVEETFTFPATKRNTAGKYMEAGYMCGLSPAAMAWQFGLRDPKFADIVRKLLTVIHPAVAEGYLHRISWPDSPAEVPTFVPPPHRIFRLDCAWGWIPVNERYGLSVVHDSASKWQRVLGWKGNDGAAAAYQCQKSMHNRIGVYAVRWWGGMFVSDDMVPENPEWEV